jgi:hypothetical protein
MKDQNSRMFSLEERRLLGLFRIKSIIDDLGSDLGQCGLTITSAQACVLGQMEEMKNEGEHPLEIAARLKDSISKFNKYQSNVYNGVLRLLTSNKGGLFYVEGPGGSGKTFLLNTLIDFSDTRNFPQLVVVSSGVASLILKDGRTAHSTFKIPIPCESALHCSVEPNSELAVVLKRTHFIIWDEVITIHIMPSKLLTKHCRS